MQHSMITDGLRWDDKRHKYVVIDPKLYIFRLFEAEYNSLARAFMMFHKLTITQMIAYKPEEDKE